MRLLENWFSRHRHPVSLVLHAIGIPMTIAALMLMGYQLCLWRWDLWWRPTGLLVGGYLFQYLGHVIEGSPMGELMLIRRLLGRPSA